LMCFFYEEKNRVWGRGRGRETARREPRGLIIVLEPPPSPLSSFQQTEKNPQIREIRESIELPLLNPELFERVGIKPPKGVLLYGPPGTGKTLLARAIAANMDANFLKVVASAIVDKYIGESARLIREMFGYARDHQPCIIFMDEVRRREETFFPPLISSPRCSPGRAKPRKRKKLTAQKKKNEKTKNEKRNPLQIDAIGGRRFSEGTSADREIQRTLMELLSQLDGFDAQGQVKMIMATNRPDVLDPALLRPGRLDRKVEIPLPNEAARAEILKIHAAKVAKSGEIDYEAIVKLADGFNGADLRNVCTEVRPGNVFFFAFVFFEAD